jgi:DNA-directed RNA polymerase subunit RPC12/RpoP
VIETITSLEVAMGDTVAMSVPLNTTPDKFISQECPECERIFKVAPGKGSPEPVTHCPYCNHKGDNCWWTKEQVKYMGAYGADQLIRPQLHKMAHDFKQKSRSNNFIKISMKSTSKTPIAPVENDDMAASITFTCCGETIRHDSANAQLHCPICGTTQRV